jgi:hypothetical protein
VFENTQVVALISLMQLERNDTEVRVRKHFQKLYEELRSHLADAYDELDQMEYKMGPNNKHKLQVCVYNASFEAWHPNLRADQSVCARRRVFLNGITARGHACLLACLNSPCVEKAEMTHLSRCSTPACDQRRKN